MHLTDDSKEDGHDKDDEDVESGNGPSLAQSPVSDVETSADNHPSLPTELTYSKLVLPTSKFVKYSCRL